MGTAIPVLPASQDYRKNYMIYNLGKITLKIKKKKKKNRWGEKEKENRRLCYCCGPKMSAQFVVILLPEWFLLGQSLCAG